MPPRIPKPRRHLPHSLPQECPACGQLHEAYSCTPSLHPPEELITQAAEIIQAISALRSRVYQAGYCRDALWFLDTADGSVGSFLRLLKNGDLKKSTGEEGEQLGTARPW
jgi:hypothetical protein